MRRKGNIKNLDLLILFTKNKNNSNVSLCVNIVWNEMDIYRLLIYGYSDAVVSQVLDELGLQLTDQLSGLPQASGSLSIAGSKKPVATTAGNDDGGNLADADADLQARLENLRRE